MSIVAGVDGGATHTRFILINEAGNILGTGLSGPTNPDNVSGDTITANISHAMQLACHEAQISPGSIEAIFLGLAGVVSETDKSKIREAVNLLSFSRDIKIDIDHDIRIALAGGLTGNEGIALIAGTGSSCYGRTMDGQSWMAGGWGHLLDDYGSGYDIGLNALKAVVQSYDGRGKGTSLTGPVLKSLGINSIPDIMKTVYYDGLNSSGHPMTKEEIASLAPIVFKEALNKDEGSISILKHGASELVKMIKAVMKALDFQAGKVHICYTGGILLNYEFYRDLISDELARALPGATLRQPVLKPISGAALLALELLGTPINNQIIQNLKTNERSK